MAFKLKNDRVAVIPEPVENKTAAGLVVPEGYNDENKPLYGIVAHVGPGHRSEYTGEIVPLDIEVGDRVFWRQGGGETWTFEDEKYTLLDGPREIIGVDVAAAKGKK